MTTARVVFAHATGFCAGVWDPVADALDEVEVSAGNLSGHGGRPEPAGPLSWWRFGEDAADMTRPGDLGVGHSMGGAALLMAEVLHPGRFTALVLVEPIVFEHGDQELVESMARRAERRTAVFGSRAEAEERIGSKDVFGRWHPGAMAGYLRDGFLDRPDGSVELACRPAFEADVYRCSHRHGMWDRLAEVTCPVLVVAGSDSDTYPPGQAESLAGRIPGAEAEWVDGTGHFLPMERPEIVAQRVRTMVGGPGGSAQAVG